MLEQLVKYYEAMAEQGRISPYGWCMCGAMYVLEVNDAGELIAARSLATDDRKSVPMQVPARPKRASNICPFFLCDNTCYLLGIDKDVKTARLLSCHKQSADLHLRLLREVDSPAARAVCAFFENWNADDVQMRQKVADVPNTCNLVFLYNGQYLHEIPDIMGVWDKEYQRSDVPEEEWGVCLATGKRGELVNRHASIKNVPGAPSGFGTTLISFNAESFESYAKTFGDNAPVSKYGMFAYTTALNSLVANPKHRVAIDGTTILFWAEHADDRYTDVILRMLFGIDCECAENELDPHEQICVMAVVPNVTRLSVRLFYQDSFGNVWKHIREHYHLLDIVRPTYDQTDEINIRWLLHEITDRASKQPIPPALVTGLCKAVMSGERYPAAIYTMLLMRIRADQDGDQFVQKVSCGRAALIKAYLLRNGSQQELKEALTVDIDESCELPCYVMGRLFAVLEHISAFVRSGATESYKIRYFNAACAKPGDVFCELLKQEVAQLRAVTNKGLRIHFDKMVGRLINKLSIDVCTGLAFPKVLTHEEQGVFVLGYYHQHTKLYTKKPIDSQ